MVLRFIMNIAGIGVIFSRGRGIDCFQKALLEGWTPPLQTKPAKINNSIPVFSVSQETVTDKKTFKITRRLDRFSKMAVLASCDAIEDSGIIIDSQKTMGIIVATSFGPHKTTFNFLDDILNYGDKGVSPILFSHSVHNAAASYISSILNSHGPTLTLTQFNFPFQQALIIAQSWIDEGRCDYVLAGAVDECGEIMEYVCSQKLLIASDGKIKPFSFSKIPVSVPGEGSVFLLLTGGNQNKKYCEIKNVSAEKHENGESKDAIYIFDTDGICGDETMYLSMANPDTKVAGYSPLFGSMPIGSGFNCVAGALMLKNQISYACPVQDNTHNLNISKITENKSIKEINCIKYDCFTNKAKIQLYL